eukprot:TRINITY_DN67815_c6_g2_i1.p1 TRINITY_DN67815_c6_g2~~TRINITY_DN67815_c6_g2_i1.p1  ORF type:complete len:125 (-),score=12.75 TRINITY_DN67815_c6_g2_i1:415-789(-)
MADEEFDFSLKFGTMKEDERASMLVSPDRMDKIYGEWGDTASNAPSSVIINDYEDSNADETISDDQDSSYEVPLQAYFNSSHHSLSVNASSSCTMKTAPTSKSRGTPTPPTKTSDSPSVNTSAT